MGSTLFQGKGGAVCSEGLRWTPQRLSAMVRSFKKTDLEACLKDIGASRSGNKSQLIVSLLRECGVGLQDQQLAVKDPFRAREVVRTVEKRCEQ